MKLSFFFFFLATRAVGEWYREDIFGDWKHKDTFIGNKCDIGCRTALFPMTGYYYCDCDYCIF
jgi:hypothetical protein